MKPVSLKSGPLIGDLQLSTQYLIKLCLDNPPDGGFKFRDFKERARVENAMDNWKLTNPGNSLDKYFELEDNDYANLVKYVKAMTWLTRSPFVVEFCEQFQN
jgi:hypothetical protein